VKSNSVFTLNSTLEFERRALELFRHQAKNNIVYKSYLKNIKIDAEGINSLHQIPFLPIELFKTQKVVTGNAPAYTLFLSSGTTGMQRSSHYVSDTTLYEESFQKCFSLFYGDIKDYAVLAILPSYYENRNSSLLYMAKDWIVKSKNKHSTFFNSKDETLLKVLPTLLAQNQKVLLLGVTFALLDMKPPSLKKEMTDKLIVMETGGMKGRGEELIRQAVHAQLCEKFNVSTIHSEYGMTELLSQAYSKEKGIFKCPPWMKMLVRDLHDPFSILSHDVTGALNSIDLANIHSCAFIATQDVGITHPNETFEVMGRVDNSDIRGCNLLTDYL
jgi:phenylacetate-coenzyme A ligase PaaK-like adenylate-forming protein